MEHLHSDLCQPTERFLKSTIDGSNPSIRWFTDIKVNNQRITIAVFEKVFKSRHSYSLIGVESTAHRDELLENWSLAEKHAAL